MQAVGLPLTRSMIRMNFNSTYFMEIFRGVDDNQTKVYESEWFTQDADHVFEPIEMTDGRLCNADPNEQIEFKFIRRNQFMMQNSEMCSLKTTLQKLNEMLKSQLVPMQEPKGKDSGASLKIHCVMEPVDQFSDYLNSGYQISLVGAIDFTYSNGSVESPQSLHYVDQVEGNHYLNSLKAVMQVLHQYDSDKKYPFYGFGAIPTHMNASKVSDCFPINGNEADPSIRGIDELVRTYQSVLHSVKLSGPTRFAPLIRQTRKHVKQCQDEKNYHVLLILTDG